MDVADFCTAKLVARCGRRVGDRDVAIQRLDESRACASLPPRVVTEPQAARMLNWPLPEVRGFGETMATPSRTKSGQSWIAFGLPLCTTKTMVDV